MTAKKISFTRIALVIVPAACGAIWLTRFSAMSQEGFSKTELQQLKELPKSKRDANACLGFEATFTDVLKEKPKAILDVPKLDMIQGTLARVLEVVSVSVSPKQYRMMVTDPQACETLKGEQSISLTVTDGKGADGRPVFPIERSFKTRK